MYNHLRFEFGPSQERCSVPAPTIISIVISIVISIIITIIASIIISIMISIIIIAMNIRKLIINTRAIGLIHTSSTNGIEEALYMWLRTFRRYHTCVSLYFSFSDVSFLSLFLAISLGFDQKTYKSNGFVKNDHFDLKIYLKL